MSIINYIKEPWRLVVAFDRHVWSIVPDKLYLEAYFRTVNGIKLNLDDPKTYCDKLNWLKLYDRNPLYSQMTDKLLVRDYISTNFPDARQYLVPLITTYDSPDQIDLTKLPDRFVIKCTHDSGSAIVCLDKDKLNEVEVKEKLHEALKREFWRHSRETAYSHCNKPKIIVEQYIYGDEHIKDKPDYKFFCFNGAVKVFQTNVGRVAGKTSVCFYDRDKQPLDIAQNVGDYVKGDPIPLSENTGLMIEIAERFSKGLPHVRVDFMESKGKIYFSEFTFYHCGGVVPLEPDRWNRIMGEWIILPK